MKNVEIYTGPLCAFCDWTKALLKKKGVAFKEINIGDDPNKISEMLKKSNRINSFCKLRLEKNNLGTTVPQNVGQLIRLKQEVERGQYKAASGCCQDTLDIDVTVARQESNSVTFRKTELT